MVHLLTTETIAFDIAIRTPVHPHRNRLQIFETPHTSCPGFKSRLANTVVAHTLRIRATTPILAAFRIAFGQRTFVFASDGTAVVVVVVVVDNDGGINLPPWPSLALAACISWAFGAVEIVGGTGAPLRLDRGLVVEDFGAAVIGGRAYADEWIGRVKIGGG